MRLCCRIKKQVLYFFFLPRRIGCLYKDGSNAVTEVNDGAWFSKDCTNCTCTSGRLRCSRIECDCTNNDHVQSICCAHCNAQASCVHQELTNVRFRSGQQWIYQCQTCECLVSKLIVVFIVFRLMCAYEKGSDMYVKFMF